MDFRVFLTVTRVEASNEDEVIEMTTLDAFAEEFARDTVAYAYEVAKFSVFEDSDAPDRKITDWSWHVQRSEPSADDWAQDGVTEHRIRNVTPLVRGPPDVPGEEALAFEYEYVSWDDEVSSKLGVRDPRGEEGLIRCTPLVPVNE